MPGKSNLSSDAAASSIVFDLEGTLRRLGGNTSLLADLVQLYDEDSPELLSRLATGISDGRGDQVRHAAHSLRGLASNFGASSLTEPLLQLEEAASRGHMQDAGELLDQVQRESVRLQESLAAHHR